MASNVTHKKTANPGDLIRSADWNDTHNTPNIDTHLASVANPHQTTLQKACTQDDDTTAIQLVDYGILPAPIAALRGKVVIVRGATADESDKMYCCMKSSGGAGQWSVVFNFLTGMYNITNMSNTFLIASVSSGEIWRSPNGTTWTMVQNTGELRSRCAGGNAIQAFTGWDRTGGPRAYVSNDGGLTWGLDHTFGAGPISVYRISPTWNTSVFFGMYGSPNHGDVYERNNLGVYALSLNTNSRCIADIGVSGINGFLYALTIDGALYEKQNLMAVWVLRHSFPAGYKYRSVRDNGTTAWVTFGSTSIKVQQSTDYNIWSNVAIPTEIRTKYAELMCSTYWSGGWYAGTHAGTGGGDVLKYKNTKWSVDLDSGESSLQNLAQFGGAVYAATLGTVDAGFLFRLQTALESYSWKLIVEG